MNEEKDLELRIKEAKSNILGDKKEKTSYKNSNVLIELIAGIAIGAFVGYHLDSYIGTKPFFLFLFCILGMIAGIYNFCKR